MFALEVPNIKIYIKDNKKDCELRQTKCIPACSRRAVNRVRIFMVCPEKSKLIQNNHNTTIVENLVSLVTRPAVKTKSP